jgi:hypothetical protein
MQFFNLYFTLALISLSSSPPLPFSLVPHAPNVFSNPFTHAEKKLKNEKMGQGRA